MSVGPHQHHATQTLVVTIPTDRIVDWDSFHSVFKEVFGFPEFYGRNQDAWIDCMGYVDDPQSGMTNVCIAPGNVLALRIDDAVDFKRRCPEQYSALIECAAFVNYRRWNAGEKTLLTLMLTGHF
ncbi:barnase inhibitor [Pararhizobium polonicum]|uniref:Barnase inhibitor n=1 Tax=Pararhizobium polonicum TaxID=1612624 RepID=A0A1C7P4K4_9HYPH|nr:barstar family protein [Pararhizobium polonicum]OBZ96159.1 barnase inhibitor [Pararhizobium polonicum]